MFIAGRTFDFIFLLVLWIAILVFMSIAEKWTVPLRTIAGVVAIDEAIGRSAETGRPCHFTTGMGSGSLNKIEDGPQIMAGLAVFSHVASLCAKQGVRLIVSVGQPDTIPILEQYLRDAYNAENVPVPDMAETLRFHTTDQGAFSSSYVSIMRRERPASDIFIGPIWKESATCIAASNQVGAMSIMGTARFAHMTWLSSFADYLLIGEEIYAAGAQLSGDKPMINSIAVQDLGKAFALASIILGMLLTLLLPGLGSAFKNLLGA